MKTLYCVRHAKSSWDYPELSDFERPLSARGRRDAPFISRIVSEQTPKPELIVTSSALRTVYTARIFSEELGIPQENMRVTNELYEADIERMLSLVQSIGDEYSSVMLVAHNPTLTEFVNLICDFELENIPTSGVVRISFSNKKNWVSIEPKSGKLVGYEYPKKYAQE